MKKLDAVVKVGSYDKDGQQKAIFKKVGALIENDGKTFLTLDAHLNLAALEKTLDGKVFINLYEPREDNQNQQLNNQQHQQKQQHNQQNNPNYTHNSGYINEYEQYSNPRF